MDKNEIDNLLYGNEEHREGKTDQALDHYVDQYRIYMHVFNSPIDRRWRSNEFFLGINTAIMGILGYLEAKGAITKPMIFLLVPFVGIAICYCWYRIISSYRKLSRAKFQVIHQIEKKLPISLFETEWQILGAGKDRSKYSPISLMERRLPIIFSILYIAIFIASLPLEKIIK